MIRTADSRSIIPLISRQLLRLSDGLSAGNWSFLFHVRFAEENVAQTVLI
jgi:hypothetical protein